MFWELFNLDSVQFSQRLQQYDIFVEARTIQVVSDVIVVLVLLVACLKWGKQAYNGFKNLVCYNNRWREQYVTRALSPMYEEYLVNREKGLYLETRFQNEPPHNSEEPEDATYGVASESLIDHFIEGVFAQRNNKRLHYVLAGSGMGKTTFSVNLFISYIYHYKKNTLPYDIRLVNLAEENVIDKIAKIPNQDQTILILDALDENIYAVTNYSSFAAELDEAIKYFRFVVITCRTQFFTDDTELPYHSHILDHGRDKGYLKYQKHFISPLRQTDIDKYINKVYGRFNFNPWSKKYKAKQKALYIVNSSRNLMVRPLLLSYIRDLVTSNKVYKSVTDIYEELIELWLQREVNNYQDANWRDLFKNKLYKLSKLVAINVYENKNHREGYYIPKAELDHIIASDTELQGVNYQYDRRSLLNRDQDGRRKFSHKSFLEYFLAQEYFQNELFEMSFQGMDLAHLFYVELCKNQIKRAIHKGLIDYKLTEEFYAGRYYYNDTLRINKSCQIPFRNILFNDYRPQNIIISSNVDANYIMRQARYINGIDTLKIEYARKIDINVLLMSIGKVKEVIIKRGDTIIDDQVIIELKHKYPEMKIVYNGTIIKSAAGTRQIKFIPMYKGIDYRSLSMLLVSAEEDLNYVVPIDMNKQMLTERAELVKIINENK